MSEPMSPAPNPAAPNPATSNPVAAKEDAVREALRQVVDPEIGMDVLMLGLIRELDLQPDKAHVVMILTTPFCPYGPQLMEQTRRTVQEAAGVPTTIELSMEMWDPSLMEEGAGQDWGLFY
jgi:metal-sulfur cluster biosynthetic enzyme